METHATTRILYKINSHLQVTTTADRHSYICYTIEENIGEKSDKM